MLLCGILLPKVSRKIDLSSSSMTTPLWKERNASLSSPTTRSTAVSKVSTGRWLSALIIAKYLNSTGHNKFDHSYNCRRFRWATITYSYSKGILSLCL